MEVSNGKTDESRRGWEGTNDFSVTTAIQVFKGQSDGGAMMRDRLSPVKNQPRGLKDMKRLGLPLGSPIFPSGCEGKLGVALIPSAQRLAWAAKQALGKAALGALFA